MHNRHEAGISKLLTWSSIVGVGWLVLGRMISMIDFEGLIVNLFAFSHLVSFERSIFIFDFNEDSFEPSTTKQVSSAKSLRGAIEGR